MNTFYIDIFILNGLNYYLHRWHGAKKIKYLLPRRKIKNNSNDASSLLTAKICWRGNMLEWI